MELQYVKVASYTKDTSCPHNDWITCDCKKCYACGWNPKVAKKRLEKIQASRSKAEVKAHG